MALQTINLGRVKGEPFRYEDFTPEQLDDLRGKDGKDFPRFTGTAAEYEAVEFDIEEGTIVTITDDFDEENLIGADTLKRVADLEDAVANFEGVDNAVYLTQEQYDALPESKLTDDVEYRITDRGIENVSASNVEYDNAVSGLGATNVQGAVDELKEDVDGLQGDISTLNESLGSLIKLHSQNEGETTKSIPNALTYLGLSLVIPAKHVAVVSQSLNNRTSGKPIIGLGYGYSPSCSSVSQLASHYKMSDVGQYYTVGTSYVISNNGNTDTTIYFYAYASTPIESSYNIITALLAQIG